MDLTKDIDIAVIQATIDVVKARSNYNSKKFLINAVKNDAHVTQEFYDEITSSHDEIVMEEATGKIPFDQRKFAIYRQDPFTHDRDIAKINVSIAELALGVQQASHLAKGDNGVPIKDLLPERGAKIIEIGNKLYNGKAIALYDLIQILRADKRHRTFMNISGITGFDTTPEIKHNDDGSLEFSDPPGDLVQTAFTVRLPRWTLTLRRFKVCEEIDQFNKLKKSNPESPDLKVLRARIKKHMPIIGLEDSDRNRDDLLNHTCYSTRQYSSDVDRFMIGWHLKNNPRLNDEALKCTKEISDMATQKTPIRMNTRSNKRCTDRIAEAFCFTKQNADKE
jgi:hypothetical protein